MVRTPEDRLSEIELYELVAEEIENNQQSKGLWLKALSDSDGDLDKGKALYVKLRVQMIKDEWIEQAPEMERRAKAKAVAELREEDEKYERMLEDKWAEKGRPIKKEKSPGCVIVVVFIFISILLLVNGT